MLTSSLRNVNTVNADILNLVIFDIIVAHFVVRFQKISNHANHDMHAMFLFSHDFSIYIYAKLNKFITSQTLQHRLFLTLPVFVF